MYSFKNLEGIDTRIIHEAFCQAFSDYQVSIDLPFDDFDTMIKRRGFQPDISVGVFVESSDQLVGFILNGLRDWKGKKTAYDLGTGVIPAHRRKGITTQMFQEVMKTMQKHHVEQYLLEVLQTNHGALQLYKKAGLSITRAYSCFKLESENSPSFTPDGIEYKITNEIADWEQASAFWDFSPSWQNSIASILAVVDVFACVTAYVDNEIVGYGIVDKKSGDIPQIAVAKPFRQQGVATNIIAILSRHTEADILKVINVDHSYEPMELALKKIGFSQFCDQYEMSIML